MAGESDRGSWSIAADVALKQVGPDIEDQLAPWPLLATIGMGDDGRSKIVGDRH